MRARRPGAGRATRRTAAAGLAAAGLAAAGRPRPALAAAAAWAAGTGELAWARIAPGPRDRDEVVTMLATSAALPFAATGWRVAGLATARRRARRPSATPAVPPAAVLLDRDGTLVEDVPYNGDPDRVRPLPGVRAALDRLRAAGVPLAVVSNQSGIARGRLTRAQVDAVNARVEALLGPLGPWLVCPHGPDDGCACRKPARRPRARRRAGARRRARGLRRRRGHRRRPGRRAGGRRARDPRPDRGHPPRGGRRRPRARPHAGRRGRPAARGRPGAAGGGAPTLREAA